LLCAAVHTLLAWSDEDGSQGTYMREEKFPKALQENLKKSDCLQYVGVEGRILLKWT